MLAAAVEARKDLQRSVQLPANLKAPEKKNKEKKGKEDGKLLLI